MHPLYYVRVFIMEKKCKVEWCVNNNKAKWYCNMHYIRLKKHWDCSVTKRKGYTKCSMEDRNIQIQDTPKVNWMVYHDAFEEEIRWFVKKKSIDFWQLESKCSHRARALFHRYLNEGNLSDNSSLWKES